MRTSPSTSSTRWTAIIRHFLPRRSEEARQASPLLLPILLGSVSFGILDFVLPVYGKRLGASALEIGGLFSVVAATMTLTRPAVGWALDRFGRRAFFVAGLVFRTGSLVLFAFATDVALLYVARLAQGFAATLTWITAYTIATDLAAPRERGRWVGRVDESIAQGVLLGGIVGILALTLLPLEVGWKLLFAGYGLAAAWGTCVAWWALPETSRREPERAEVGESPLSWDLVKLMIVVFAASASMSMVGPVVLIFMQDRFTSDVAALAVAYIPSAVVAATLPSRLGRLSDRFGRAPMMAVGLVGSGFASLVLPSLPSLGWLMVVWATETLGWTMAAPAQEALVADLTRHQSRGRGYGLYTFAGSLGATLGPLIGGWVYDAVGHGVPFYLNTGIMLACATWVLALLPRKAIALDRAERV